MTGRPDGSRETTRLRFSKSAVTACSTGSYNGGLCAVRTVARTPLATVTEWNLGKNGSPNNYDVSLVDGCDIPMLLRAAM
ncbi:hypothetical protein C8R44DRAFT_762138, partial [Mycena epipterygia]